MSSCARIASSLGLIALLQGCAFISQGPTQEIEIVSTPAGAAFAAGEVRGVTPAKVRLPKEETAVVVRKEGYREYRRDLRLNTSGYFYWSIPMGVVPSLVDILTGSWKEFDAPRVEALLEEIPEVPERLALKVTTDPSPAKLQVDGVEVGPSPAEPVLTWRRSEAEKRVQVSAPGFRPKTVEVTRGKAALHVALEPEEIPVAVRLTTSPPGAEITIDGKPAGQTPRTIELTWTVRTAPWTVDLSKPGYKPRRVQLTRERPVAEVELEEIVETIPLKLQVAPAGASVEVDGAPVDGPVALRWSVSLRRHVIRVSRPGYRSVEAEVPRAAAEAPLKIRLVPSLPAMR